MTDSSASPGDINMPTLEILCRYIDALLPVLDSEKPPLTSVADVAEISASEIAENDSKFYDGQSLIISSTKLLWAVQDQAALEKLTTLISKASLISKTALQINSENPSLFSLQQLAKLPIAPRYQLACFWLPELSADGLQHYIPLLMRYRDLYTAHMIIALDSSLNLQAYGFTPLDLLDQTLSSQSSLELSASLTLWQFNLYDYKKLPNWLNADHWANPENWEKNRW